MASIAILDHAFDDLGVARVSLEFFSDNDAAAKLYRRLGFTPTPKQPSPRLKDGAERPVSSMVLDAAGWSRTKERTP